MRLHRLEVVGVGMFKDRQVIDFDALTDGGLFCIDGPTGAGKSTLIDAIGFALFGAIFGADTLNRVRSRFCGPGDPTEVTCEFTAQGRRHVITRVPPLREGDAAGGRARAGQVVLREVAADGSQVRALVKDGEIREYLEALLGMTQGQFRRLVVLPQGQFAELLTMSPKERLEVLRSLLGMDFYDRLQNELRDGGERARAHREAAALGATRALDRLEGQLHGHLTSAATPATAEERLHHYGAVLDALAMAAEEAERGVRTAEEEAGQAARLAEQAERLLTCLTDLAAARQAATDARAGLHPADAGVAEGEVDDRLADLRREEGRLEAPVAWEAAAAQRAADRAKAVAALTEDERRATELAAAYAQLPVEREEAERRRQAAEVVAAAGPAARAEAARMADLLAKGHAHAALLPQVHAGEADLQRAEQAERAAELAVDGARRAVAERQRGQRSQRAALLAGELCPDQPCPVCGSPAHPAPAAAPAGAAVTDEAIEQAEEELRTRWEALERTRVERGEAQVRQQALRHEAAVLEGALGGVTAADLANQARGAAEEASRTQAAAEEAERLAQEIADLAQRTESARAHIDEVRAHVDRQRAELLAADREATARAQEIAALIGDATSATDRHATVQTRIRALVTLTQAVRALAEATATVPAADRATPLAEATQRAADLQLGAREARRRSDALAEQAAVLAGTLTQARPLLEAAGHALQTSDAVREQTEDEIVLADLVNARGGVNPGRLPLYSFAVQRSFHQVLEAASGHLHNMSAGRFTFDLKEESTRGHAGLGIAVEDLWTGRQQDPKDLSGGEKFYASLALALGLAEAITAEAGGSSLETLFVDEGFGSLDQETLQRVLDQLNRLRAGGRAVGVISHVTEMRQEIANRVEVIARPGRPSEVRQGRPG